MPDFCYQCALKIFGITVSDFEGLTTKKATQEGFYLNVICRECGPTQVDHLGRCRSNGKCGSNHQFIEER